MIQMMSHREKEVDGRIVLALWVSHQLVNLRSSMYVHAVVFLPLVPCANPYASISSSSS